jgi:hypothetical protein
MPGAQCTRSRVCAMGSEYAHRYHSGGTEYTGRLADRDPLHQGRFKEIGEAAIKAAIC